MTASSLVALCFSAVMETFGDDGVYHPQIGEQQAVRILVRSGEKVIDALGVTTLRADGRLMEIMRNELLMEPRPGDVVEVRDLVWRIRSVRPSDENGIAWTLDCVPV